MSVFTSIYNFLLGGVQTLVSGITSILPSSPFRPFIDGLDLPFMAYVNWIVPIGTFVKILLAWVTAIGLYYVYSVVLRWIKAIS